jgi:Uncharacterized conserved protein (DUF2183)
MNVGELIRSVGEHFDRGINEDEHIVFYPAYGFQDADGQWKLCIRGRIFERVGLSADFSSTVASLLGVGKTEDDIASLGLNSGERDPHQLFAERVKPFLVEGERGETFPVTVLEEECDMGESDASGYFETAVLLPPDRVVATLRKQGQPWVSFTTRDRKGQREFRGQSQLLPPTGITVVSDIDDTIKDTNISEPREMVANTLFRPFRAVAGMTEVYRSWEQRGASFVYLSNGPYQLYQPLAQFLGTNYPAGAYYLRQVNWQLVRHAVDKLIAADDEMGLTENAKKHNLIPILRRFPTRRFLLIGDSTERDADIYADLYLGENFPHKFTQEPYRDRIMRIYIRDVANSRRRSAAAAAIERINQGGGRAIFFKDPKDIAQDAAALFH